jgi:hypothetical protein
MFTLPLNPESKVLGSVVWQPFICHRTGLTLRGLTREVMSPNVKRRSRVRAPNSSFYVSRRNRFREFLKGDDPGSSIDCGTE